MLELAMADTFLTFSMNAANADACGVVWNVVHAWEGVQGSGQLPNHWCQ